LNDTINRLRARLADQQQKAPSDMLVRLRTIVDNLNNNIPSINNDINREYYYCYGAGKVDTQSTGSVIVYVVKGEAFGQYLQNAYGQSVGAPRLTTGSDYRLQIVDPYSQVWTAKYGYPTLAENGGTGFSCISEGSMQTGSGRITSINSDSIVVSGNDGRSVSLAVGGCSRI
jgi:hypothetical protein